MNRNELRDITGTNPLEIVDFFKKIRYDVDKFEHNKDRDEEHLTNVHFRSPEEVVSERLAVCNEAAFTAAYALDEKYKPIFISLLASINYQNQSHMVLGYRDPKTNLFGSIGHSRNNSQKSREPIYKTLKEIILTYIIPEENISYFRAKNECLPQFIIEKLSRANLSIHDFEYVLKQDYRKNFDESKSEASNKLPKPL